ncbi:MAG: 3-dehydroquinate dehydratase (3-dehydroquinase) [Stictis urceolatum]|nr:3-dehydroquinate dehydratase (3-dehydroquinase) [Stictis urceolata]
MARSSNPIKVSILGHENIVVDYDIWGNWIVSDLLEHVPSSTYVLITDSNLSNTYVSSFRKCFESTVIETGADSRLVNLSIPPGETSKSRKTKAAIEDWMLSKDRDPPCDTKTVLIALGGGVIGDMIGYVAATFKRGIRYVQVPTSLLAMVDSSLGGKTAIDTPDGKNLIGAFWQPSRIYIDLQFLNSLPTRQFINGLAEVIKTAAIWDEQSFSALERNSDQLMAAIEKSPDSGGARLSGVRGILKDIVLGSVRVKAHVVSADEREGGLRNLLNFGHSIGHAFEGILAPQILHGECVSIGMVLEALLARYLGVLDGASVARLTKCLSSYGLPISYHDENVQSRSGSKLCRVDELLAVMAVDKKNIGHKKRVVLLSGIGRTHELKASIVSDSDIRLILSAGTEVHPLQPENVEKICIPPGSKSISNRALVLAALATGECKLHNLLHSDDTEVMLQSLSELQCATFDWVGSGGVLMVKGNGGKMKASPNDLYLGNAGTASRFLTTVATLVRAGPVESSMLTGNSRMKVRPIGPLVEALRTNGAEIAYIENIGSLPLRVKASGGFAGGCIDLAATVSSQYVSSILMCAPYAKKPVTLRLVGGKPVSQPYIDMTIAMMAAFGVKVIRSLAEDYTYHIPQQRYQSPPDYYIESDASSATYPLALAAITGTTCTVPNIGSSSLQGDARFAIEVLRPMGCTVNQTKTATSVTGPRKGGLSPLPHVDMEPMTDAFLTAAVLASVAQGPAGGNTTRITGIANQRVKECNRIKAMKDELSKFGVRCRELDNGIEIDGIEWTRLQLPLTGVHCYDDHRVAMSFSVLALAAPQPTIVQDRECVGKTWPGWWDELHQTFNARLEGFDMDAYEHDHRESEHVRRSLFLIGMRGVGKSTVGAWTAKLLSWPFVDLDTQLESETGSSIPDIIKSQGWEEFRTRELAMLRKSLADKSSGFVFACGGGIVETSEARRLLRKYHQSGGLVLFLHRSVDDILEYLHLDKSRPAYADDIQSVWERREPWYIECSNFEYYSPATDTGSLLGPFKDYSRLVTSMMGRVRSLETIRKKSHSFFVSLTVSDVSQQLESLAEIAVGSDAVELRVDLLVGPRQEGSLPSSEYVGQQLSLLRRAIDVPLIFTVRSRSQGGKFPDEELVHTMKLYQLALRMGVEFLDVEMRLPESFLRPVANAKGQTKIIASHHDPSNHLRWSDGSWVAYYNKALEFGDIVKLVGVATNQSDNENLQQFRAWAESSHDTPLIALNMCTEGQLSRIQNTFLTPVTHPKLAAKGAPGQLSARQIRKALVLHGVIKPKHFFLFGAPISASCSPALHNSLFAQLGLPHIYELFEIHDASKVEDILCRPDFGGASVTIPLKVDILPYLDEISEDAKIIGAVNTIVVDPRRRNREGFGLHRTGFNTDWRGMTLILTNAGASSNPDRSGLVVGGGGTARAAIHALKAMGFSPIYVVGRSREKIGELVASFPADYNLRAMCDISDVATVLQSPTVAIGTIPADYPMDPMMYECVGSLLDQSDPKDPGRILLDMAYKPFRTELVQLAEERGWAGVSGFQALAAQGIYQVRESRDDITIAAR